MMVGRDISALISRASSRSRNLGNTTSFRPPMKRCGTRRSSFAAKGLFRPAILPARRALLNPFKILLLGQITDLVWVFAHFKGHLPGTLVPEAKGDFAFHLPPAGVA